MNSKCSCHALATYAAPLCGLGVGSCNSAELSGMQPDLPRRPARGDNCPRVKKTLLKKAIDGRKQRHASIKANDCSKSAVSDACTSVTSRTGIRVAYAVENAPFLRGSRYRLIVGRVAIYSLPFLAFPVCAARRCTPRCVAERAFPNSP